MKQIFLISIFLSVFWSNSKAQDSLAIAGADTTHFSIDQLSGWELFTSYFEDRGSDSCVIELVFQHSNNIEWGSYYQVGRIKTGVFIPANETVLSFNMGQREYFFKIDKEGKCWVRKKNGDAHIGNKVVLAFRVAYKK